MFLGRSHPNDEAIGEKFKDVGNYLAKSAYFILQIKQLGSSLRMILRHKVGSAGTTQQEGARM